jgi:hypothetical protein
MTKNATRNIAAMAKLFPKETSNTERYFDIAKAASATGDENPIMREIQLIRYPKKDDRFL